MNTIAERTAIAAEFLKLRAELIAMQIRQLRAMIKKQL